MGLPGGEKVDGGELVICENRGNFAGFAHQRMIVGAGGAPDIQPRGVVVAQQRCPAFLEGMPLPDIHMHGEPPHEEVAAQGHVLLAVALDLGVGTFQTDVGVGEAALHEVRLRPHDLLRALTVAPGDLIICRQRSAGYGRSTGSTGTPGHRDAPAGIVFTMPAGVSQESLVTPVSGEQSASGVSL